MIGEGNFNNLSKYRKQELILKYLAKGNIKRAVEMIIFIIYIYIQYF